MRDRGVVQSMRAEVRIAEWLCVIEETAEVGSNSARALLLPRHSSSTTLHYHRPQRVDDPRFSQNC